MNHSFLFREGRWLASGILLDEHDVQVPIAGSAVIEHREGKWFNLSRMKLLGDPPLELKNDYEIEPFPEGRTSTAWTSFNPDFGRMTGSFAVIGDAILSTYQSADGEYTGSEYLLREDDHTYQVRGVLFRGEVKVSSWDAMLTREDSAG